MTSRSSETSRFRAVVRRDPPVRAGIVAILTLIIVLSTWTIIGYLAWMNDLDPSGVLNPADRLRVAERVEVASTPTGRPERVVVIVIDGLRADFASTMPTLNALAALGVDAVMDVGLPSMSRPVYASISSGTRQGRSGIRTNAFHGAATVDSIWERAREREMRVVAISNLNWWRILFPRGFDRYLVTTAESFGQAVQLALEGQADLFLFHPTAVDFAGHQHGGRSPEYRTSVREMDRLLSSAVLPSLDFSRDLLVICSDHGHRDKGGHGGAERHVPTVRFVARGVGVSSARSSTPGLEFSADQLAPTLSVLMGIPFPRDAEGAPLWSILDESVLGRDYIADRQLEWSDHSDLYLTALNEQGPAHFDPAGGFEAWRGAMAQLRLEGRSIRLGTASVILVVGLFLILALRRDPAWRVLLAGFSFVIFYVVAAIVTQNIASLSVAEREYRYLLRLASIGVLALIGQHLVFRVLSVRDWGTSFLLGAWLSGGSVGLVLAHYGIPLTAPLPSPQLMFWPLFATFMTATQAGTALLSLSMLHLMRRPARPTVPAVKPRGSEAQPQS